MESERIEKLLFNLVYIAIMVVCLYGLPVG